MSHSIFISVFLLVPQDVFLGHKLQRLVSSPGAFYITSTAQKTLLFAWFSLPPSLVLSSTLLDDDTTVCLFVVSPILLCTVFSYLAQEIWKQLGILLNSLFVVCLQKHAYSCLVSKTGKILNCTGADIV